MKKTDKIKYQKMTVDKLQKEMVTIKTNLIQLRIKHSLGQVKDTSLFKKSRYVIAYLNTLIAQKQNEKATK